MKCLMSTACIICRIKSYIFCTLSLQAVLGCKVSESPSKLFLKYLKIVKRKIIIKVQNVQSLYRLNWCWQKYSILYENWPDNETLVHFDSTSHNI